MKKLIICILCLSFIFTLSCGGDNDTPPSPLHVVYSITSECAYSCDIALQTPHTTWHKNNINLPWEYSFDALPGNYIYLFAYDPICKSSCWDAGVDDVDLTVSITVNGIIRDSKTCCGDNDPNTPTKCNSIPLIAHVLL